MGNVRCGRADMHNETSLTKSTPDSYKGILEQERDQSIGKSNIGAVV
jgi:hypothetical protein